jgi:hypothetical protein
MVTAIGAATQYTIASFKAEYTQGGQIFERLEEFGITADFSKHDTLVHTFDRFNELGVEIDPEKLITFNFRLPETQLDKFGRCLDEYIMVRDLFFDRLSGTEVFGHLADPMISCHGGPNASWVLTYEPREGALWIWESRSPLSIRLSSGLVAGVVLIRNHLLNPANRDGDPIRVERESGIVKVKIFKIHRGWMKFLGTEAEFDEAVRGGTEITLVNLLPSTETGED